MNAQSARPRLFWCRQRLGGAVLPLLQLMHVQTVLAALGVAGGLVHRHCGDHRPHVHSKAGHLARCDLIHS